ncbi:unnamed protein product, partial [Staurois parvus]
QASGPPGERRARRPPWGSVRHWALQRSPGGAGPPGGATGLGPPQGSGGPPDPQVERQVSGPQAERRAPTPRRSRRAPDPWGEVDRSRALRGFSGRPSPDPQAERQVLGPPARRAGTELTSTTVGSESTGMTRWHWGSEIGSSWLDRGIGSPGIRSFGS